jgi:hypothetical protein
LFQIWNDFCKKCELFLPMLEIAIKNVHKLETKVGNLQTLISWTAKYMDYFTYFGWTENIAFGAVNTQICYQEAF